MKKKKRILNGLGFIMLTLLAGYLIPERFTLPVENMNSHSFNHRSFWYYPWGASVCHKGVDVFAPKGKGVFAATSGIVFSVRTHHRGGKMILILGPKWHIHHYLHLDTILISNYSFVHRGTLIGRVGNSGNAANKPSHLHYGVTTPIPYLWQMENGIQGWRKMWYIDPTPYLMKSRYQS